MSGGFSKKVRSKSQPEPLLPIMTLEYFIMMTMK